jgi:tetraacyldisaccharide 4'-kinase
MKEPWFWRDTGIAARAAAGVLTPAAFVYDCGQRLRIAMTAPVSVGAPVICVGNATLGGVGKTPFALALHRLLKDRGVNAGFLSRGYGGALQGPVVVTSVHDAAEVGDEPILLAAAASTWIAKDRVAGARAATAAGADAIIMDDGFQNPALKKDFSFLLVSAADTVGNACVFPAGPLREQMARALARANAVVVIGDGSPALDLNTRPVFRARTEIQPTIAPQKAVAFCGIGRPERFFNSLEEHGFALVSTIAFQDHHPFTASELAALHKKSKNAGAALITTEKDLVRLAPDQRTGIAVAKLTMTIDDPDGLTDLVMQKIGQVS